MTKILMLFCCLLATIVTATAQANDVYQKPRVSITDSVLKQHMKKGLRFTAFQIDSVLSIQRDFNLRNAELENDNSSSEDDINIQIKSLIGERSAKLRTILTAYQVTQFDALYERLVKIWQD